MVPQYSVVCSPCLVYTGSSKRDAIIAQKLINLEHWSTNQSGVYFWFVTPSNSVVAYLLKTRSGEPEKQPLLWSGSFLGNGHETKSETMFGATQHILISKNRRPLLGSGSVTRSCGNGYNATIEELLQTGLSTVIRAEGL
jgi:hypothetical protein